MKTLQRKIIKVLLCFTLLLPGMFSPFTCPGFSFPIFNLLTTVKAEEDPGTTTATHTGIAALIALLMASGIRFVGDYETVVQPAVTQLWEDFSSYAGNQLTLAELGAGIAITQGYMRVSSSVNNAVAGFQSWYQNTFNVPNNGNVSVTVPGAVVYQTAPYSSTWVYLKGSNVAKWYITSNVDVRTVLLTQNKNNMNQNNTNLFWVSTVSGVNYFYGYGNSGYGGAISVSAVVDGVTYYYGYGPSGSDFNNFIQAYKTAYPDCVIEVSNRYSYTDAISYTYGANAGIGDISMEGQTYELKDGYQLDNDQAKLIDIAGLSALAATLGLALENVTDLVNDIPLIYGFPWAQDYPDVYPNTPADTIPWVDTPTSVIPADVPEYVPTTPSGTDSYKVLGLERVFPFSIPFDLIALVRVLNAEPVTPSFTFKLYDPYKHRNVSQTVTLEQFSSVASVFRVGVVLLFLAALIKLTRILIRG